MIEIHQNHPTFHHVNSPPKMPVQNAGKLHFEYQNTLHNVKGQAKYSNSTFLAWVIIIDNYFGQLALLDILQPA